MNREEAVTMIERARGRMAEAFPQYSRLIEDTQVYLFQSSDRTQKRIQVADEISACLTAVPHSLAGETLIGRTEFAVIMYYDCIHPQEFTHFLLREYGHVISAFSEEQLFSEAQDDLEQDLDTPLRSGTAFWSELIAEVIAYRVENGDPKSVSWLETAMIEALLDEAVNTSYLSVNSLAKWCAMYLEDPTIIACRKQNPGVWIGADNCDLEVMPYLEKLLQMISLHLCRKEYWKIEREELISLGNQIDDLWDFCAQLWNQRVMRVFADLLKRSAKYDAN